MYKYCKFLFTFYSKMPTIYYRNLTEVIKRGYFYED